MLLNTYTDSLDFNALTQWIDQALSSVMPAWGVVLTECILIGLCLLLGYALIALALIYVERKVCPFSSVVSVPTVSDPTVRYRVLPIWSRC